MKIIFNPITGNFDAIATSGGGGGGGDVSGPGGGPGSSTDNAVVRWDGTTGTLIQNSTAILNDDGVLEVLALLQQDTIPALVTLIVASGEVYIIGDELNVDGTLEVDGTVDLV